MAMKKFQTESLINDLQTDVQVLLHCADFLKQHKNELLTQPAPDKWSAAQALEHVNRYGRHYIPAINKAVSVGSSAGRNAWYTPGLLGNYFVNTIRPKNLFEIKSGMKAPKGYAPDNSLDADEVLNEFIQQQQTLLQLLEISRQRDLNTIRIP